MDTMFTGIEHTEQSSCPPWQLLLRHAVQAERLTRQERDFVVDHIGQCHRCSDIYGALSDAEVDLWRKAAGAAGAPMREAHFTHSPKEALADLWRRVDENKARPYRQRRGPLALRVGTIAAAACILIAIGIGWAMMHKGGSEQGVAANTAGLPAAFAELVTPEGRKPLAMNQPVVTNDQPQEVLLGGMHRVVMNRDTEAVFSAHPASEVLGGAPGEVVHDSKITYEIQLAQGELYVEVVPGNPFILKTSNARLDITGTKFNVLTDGDKTELALLKGSVRFSALDQSEQAVSVTAGHASTITGRRTPSAPSPVDALATTAWARDLALTNAIASMRAGTDIHLLYSIRDYWPRSKTPDLNSLNYEQWRDEHREWCAREFPWIFKIQAALKDRHGIEADYVELLMVSGDIWQFHYPRSLGQPIPVFDPTAIDRIARHYKIDGDGLLKTLQSSSLKSPITSVDSSTTGPSKGCPAEIYLSALKDWQSTITSAADNSDGLPADLLLFSLHAGTYLANTRTAAYLWIKENPDNAEVLLAQPDYRASCLPQGLSARIMTGKPLSRYLSDQATSAHKVARAIGQMPMALNTNNCGRQADPLTMELFGHLSDLTKEEFQCK